MLSLKPASLMLGENGFAAPFRIPPIADANHTPHDLTVTVTVTALPSHGTVLKEDGITQVGLGELVTATELAALKFRPDTRQTGFAIGSMIKPSPEGRFVLNVPQNGEPRPIGVQASGFSLKSSVTITELPSNGIVLLADGTTAVTRQQTLSLAQLNELMFAPAADASGTATNGSLLLNHKVLMDAGHDEYWTDSQVANVEAAKSAGVNLVFLSGNEIFWQTQFAPSIDGSGTANRTLPSYKDSHFETLINPSGQGTGAFEAPVSWGGANAPSNALTGTVSVDETPTLGTISNPFDMTQLRFWRNTSVAATAPGNTASLEPGHLGYEWDSSPDNGFMPAGLIAVSSTTLQEPTVNAQFGNPDVAGTATHNLVEYRDPTSGALVFGAGTVFWSWGLSSQHDPGPDGNTTTTDPNVQQAMVNLYFDAYSGQTNGSLTAPGEAANGVYAYGSGSVFPGNLSISGDNYWVDVVFNDMSSDPQANNDSGFTVAENGTLTIAASALLANDADPAGRPFSIASVSSPVNGTASYSAQTQTVTFIPTAGYAGAASFTYLHAHRRGGNEVYADGSSSLFPTNGFNSTSYGVDVVFKAQLAA
jgi:hypothetical protein